MTRTTTGRTARGNNKRDVLVVRQRYEEGLVKLGHSCRARISITTVPTGFLTRLRYGSASESNKVADGALHSAVGVDPPNRRHIDHWLEDERSQNLSRKKQNSGTRL
jgi:hypothetical protein